jgi:hypothetical protein
MVFTDTPSADPLLHSIGPWGTHCTECAHYELEKFWHDKMDGMGITIMAERYLFFGMG